MQKRRRNLKCVLLLCAMAFFNVPCLGLICPVAAGAAACSIAATGLGALALVGAATGPVGWGLWGLAALWTA